MNLRFFRLSYHMKVLKHPLCFCTSPDYLVNAAVLDDSIGYSTDANMEFLQNDNNIFLLILTSFVHAVFRKNPLRVFCCNWMRIGTLNSWMRTPTWYNLFCFFGGRALAGAGAFILQTGGLSVQCQTRKSHYGFLSSCCPQYLSWGCYI